MDGRDDATPEARDTESATPEPHREVIGHYRRDMLAVPWIGALVGVPLVLTLLGGAFGAAPAPAGTPAPTATVQPTVTVAVPAPAPTSSTNVFQLLQVGKTLSVAGSVPDAAAKKSTIAALTSAYGSDVKVADHLTVTAGSRALDAAALANAANAFKQINGLTLDAAQGGARLSGVAASQDAKKAAADAATALVGGPVDANGVLVGDPTQPIGDCSTAASYVQMVTTATEIQFQTGGSTLTTDSVAALKRLADAGVKCTNISYKLAGNTDNTGTDAVNKPLSLKRADAVKAELVKDGMPAERITTAGNGSSSPVANNATADGRAKNRRVDVTVA